MRVKTYKLYFLLTVFLFLSVFFGLTVFYPITLPKVSVILPEDFENYLATSEKTLGPTPGTEKKIIWANPEKNKTRTSFVYLHGFPATQKEISPVPELLAKKFGANLFMTRLSGHGLGTEGLRQMTVKSMLADAEEALQVAQKIGDQVVVIGTSTGAMLSLYLAYQHPEDVFAEILISPNFRPKKWESLFAKGPFGKTIAHLVLGDYHGFKPSNAEEEKYWTTKYPSEAVTELMNLIEGINRLSLKDIRVPTLVLYTEEDQVVDIPLIKKNFTKLGSPRKKLQSVLSHDHVLAGDILSPKTTYPVVGFCDDFLSSILR